MKSDKEWLGLDRQEDGYVQYEKKVNKNTAYNIKFYEDSVT